MAHYSELADENKEVFKKILSDKELDRIITVELMGDSKLKEPGYKVSKAGDRVQFKLGVDVFIDVNEEIFDSLTPEQQVILADEAIASISVNMESGAVKILKTDFSTYMLMLKKYTNETMVTFKESIKSLYDAMKDREEGGGAEVNNAE